MPIYLSTNSNRLSHRYLAEADRSKKSEHSFFAEAVPTIERSEFHNYFPDNHLRAYRICRAAAATVWVGELRLAISLLLNTRTRYLSGKWQLDRPLWAEIRREDWESIRKMLRAVAQHRIWTVRVDGEVLSALSSTKVGDWHELLLKGRLPGRAEELFPKLDQNFIFKAGVS